MMLDCDIIEQFTLSGDLPFDLSPVREASLEDLDLHKFEHEYLPRRVSPELLALNGRTIGEWLESVKFVYKEGGRYIPTVTCLFLFGKRPQDFFPHACIDFMRFEGDKPDSTPLDRKIIEGPLDHQIKVGVELVERFSTQSSMFLDNSPVRRDIYEYPLRAIREVLANAVVHRSYEGTRASVTIKIFDDRVEIFSPGGLYGTVTKENFGKEYISDYRNLNLAVGLSILGLVERAGTGVPLIKRQMRENGSFEPLFEIGDTYLLTKLPAHPYYQATRAYQKGLIEAETGDRKKATDYLYKAVDVYPDLTEAWTIIGRTEGQNGNTEAARKAFRTALDKNARYERAYLDWGKLEESIGDKEAAYAVWRQGTQALPESWALLMALGQAELQNKAWQKASLYFRQALKFQPENIRLLRSLGELALREKNWADATQYFQKALQMVEGNDRGPLFLSLMKAHIGAGAERELVKYAFDEARNHGSNAQELFSLYYRYTTAQGQHAEALQIVELAREKGYQLTPYKPELTVGGIPFNLQAKSVESELHKLLHDQQLAFVGIAYKPPHTKFVTIQTATEKEADAIVRFLNGRIFHGRKLTAQRKQ